MNRKLRDRHMVRKSAKNIRRTTTAELARLASRADEPVDTSDIPERVGPCNRVVREVDGRIVKPRESPLRAAILAEINRRGISGHRLWKEARVYCDTIPESAVYEFLAGKRQIGLAYLDAILEAMDLTVSPR
ncbi:MAG: hypothetical protein GXY44_07415 [Phycisphaerales bacterium]|nr:hypothetical protein [Phycisphaerales bacterium]